MKIFSHLLKSIVLGITLLITFPSCSHFEDVTEFQKINQLVEPEFEVFTEGEMGQGFKPKQELVTRD